MRPSAAMYFAEMLTGTADGGFVIDAEGRIVVWNHAAENMLGYTVREAVGRPCCDLLMGHDDNGNRLCCRGYCYVRGPGRMRDQVHNFDMRTRTKAGSTIWVNVSTLMVSSDGIGDMTVHLLRDVTATREILALIRERLSTPAPLVPAAPDGNGALTRRELEILRIISTGLNTKDAAEKLHVSPATVRNHVQNILGKLGAHSRLEAVAYATRHRLI
ncbi:MAG TPA: LuxR C-terminal-related transcriptional regulator [Gemmatimonadales bacterium]|nr:LuxR C-terminal-related transcriptional regulator [Gemmatimonadales bacterium]